MSIYSHVIARQVSSVAKKTIQFSITNGTECRMNEITIDLDSDPDAAIAADYQALWESGTMSDMQSHRAFIQRALDPVINAAINDMFMIFAISAEPDIDQMIAAGEAAFANTPKLAEYQKLSAMLQAATETQRNKFMALMLTINTSKVSRR